jgi:hypothetical protein
MSTVEHFYQNIHGRPDWLLKAYDYVLAQHPRKDIEIAEVGCWLGSSLCYLGVEMLNKKMDFKINAIDTWVWKRLRVTYNPNLWQSRHFSCQDQLDQWKRKFHIVISDETAEGVRVGVIDCYREFLENTAVFGDRLNVIKNDSLSAVNLFKDESLDVVCLDNDHRYEHMLNEISQWYSKVKWGGWLIGDGHCMLRHAGVVRAARDLFSSYMVIDPNGEIFSANQNEVQGAWLVKKQ